MNTDIMQWRHWDVYLISILHCVVMRQFAHFNRINIMHTHTTMDIRKKKTFGGAEMLIEIGQIRFWFIQQKLLD